MLILNYAVPWHAAIARLRTIAAFFDDHSEADRAIERLAEAGIPRVSIQMIAFRGNCRHRLMSVVIKKHCAILEDLNIG